MGNLIIEHVYTFVSNPMIAIREVFQIILLELVLKLVQLHPIISQIIQLEDVFITVLAIL